jgi:transcriptional regulator GlxA family with amidase domain
MSEPASGAFLLFDRFQTLDVFGPVEVLGAVPEVRPAYWSVDGGMVQSVHGASVATDPVPADPAEVAFVLVPGGAGARAGVKDDRLLEAVRRTSAAARHVLGVCTGAALLARAGLLDGRRATTNKRAFDWVAGFGENVRWQRAARWAVDGPLYTASGVSAGLDMSLAFVEDVYGREQAEQIARTIEYERTEDPARDPFALE